MPQGEIEQAVSTCGWCAPVGETPRVHAHTALESKGYPRSTTRASPLGAHDPTEHQPLSRRLPQAQPLEAGQDFLEEIRQLVVVGDEAEAEPVKAGLGQVLEFAGDRIGILYGQLTRL